MPSKLDMEKNLRSSQHPSDYIRVRPDVLILDENLVMEATARMVTNPKKGQ